MKCDIFIDDLENILSLLPKSIIKIHFDNTHKKNKNDTIFTINNWKNINKFVKKLLKNEN